MSLLICLLFFLSKREAIKSGIKWHLNSILVGSYDNSHKIMNFLNSVTIWKEYFNKITIYSINIETNVIFITNKNENIQMKLSFGNLYININKTKVKWQKDKKKLVLKYNEFCLIHKKKLGFFITLNKISLPISKIILLLKLFRG